MAAQVEQARLLADQRLARVEQLESEHTSEAQAQAAAQVGAEWSLGCWRGGGDDAFGELESASPRVRKAMMDARKYREGKAAGQGGGGWDAAA